MPAITQITGTGYLFPLQSGNSGKYLTTDGNVLSWGTPSGGGGGGTVTSVGLSSATTGVTIGGTPITTSGTLTIAIATASGTSNGLLSSTDWTTFNNKQSVITNPVTGTGTSNYLSKWTSSSALGNSLVFDNGTNVGIGTATPGHKLDVSGLIRAYADATYNGENGAIIASNATNLNKRVFIGYDGTIDAGFIQSVFSGTSYKNLLLNPTSGNVIIGSTSDSGDKLQINGAIKTAPPTGYVAKPWKLGDATSGTITPDYYLKVEIDGQIYSIPALLGTP